MNINYNGALIGAEGNILALHNRAFAYGDAVTDVSKYSYQQMACSILANTATKN